MMLVQIGCLDGPSTSGAFEMEATTVRASYKDKSLSAQFLTGDIPELLRSMDGVHIGDAKKYVIRVLTSNYSDRHMAVTLLWLACQGDQGNRARDEALKGGAT